MDAYQRMLAESEDDYVLFLARLDSKHCDNRVRAHIRGLQHHAMIAFTAGYCKDALWFAEREFELSCRAFGIADPGSRASMKALAAFRKWADSIQAKTVKEDHLLAA